MKSHKAFSVDDRLTRRAFLRRSAMPLFLCPLLPMAMGGNASREAGCVSGTCAATPPNVAGPYWRAESPWRSNMREGIDGGEVLLVSGRVLGADCKPISGALIDVWQADHQGRYDLDRDDLDRSVHLLRGRLRTEADGTYAFETIKPAPYRMMGTLRPAHIHFKVSAEGFAALTTQLYFDGDPHHDTDPLRSVRPELVQPAVRVEDAARAENLGLAVPFLTTEFDITLRER